MKSLLLHQIILIITGYVGLWFLVKNYQSFFNDDQYSIQEPEGKFKDGDLDDTSKTFYQDGTLKEIEFYRSNKQSGIWQYFSKNGKLTKTETYSKDTLVNSKE